MSKTESKLQDILILYGRPFSRLLEKDGKPLSEKEKAKESERFDKELEKRRKETSEENTRERRKYEERRAQQRKFAKEIPEAFNLTLLPEERISGRALYVIQADPRRATNRATCGRSSCQDSRQTMDREGDAAVGEGGG